MTREATTLRSLIYRVAFRIGVSRALRWILRAAAVLGSIILGWALLTIVIPISLPLEEVALAAGVGFVIGAAVLFRLLRPSSLDAARIIDRRLGLADRLSTAIELLARPGAPGGLMRLQIADAVLVAQSVVPRAAAPVRLPREAWAVVAIAGAVALWAHSFQGWTIPGLPAARHAVLIHREGRILSTIGRQLDAASRARGLPETRRAIPGLLDLGQRLQAPRITRRDALRALQEAGRQLQAARSRVERRLGGAGTRGVPGSQEARISPTLPGDSARLQQAIQELESLTERLRNDRGDTRDDIAKRLGAVAQSLEQMNAPMAARRNLAAARREIERGRAGSAAASLGDALADMEGLERMLGDDQALGEAKRQVEKSAERIAQGGPMGAGLQATEHSTPDSRTSLQAPGPNPVSPTSEEAAPPPPGPNQGSLPGEGRGGRSGAPTLRLGGTRTEEHLTGRQGEGTAVTRDLLAPGRVGSPQVAGSPIPATVARENDRALARDPLPPAYLTLIRRYFETPESSR